MKAQVILGKLQQWTFTGVSSLFPNEQIKNSGATGIMEVLP